MLRLAAVFTLVSLAGCMLYAGDDQPPPPCDYGYADGAPYPGYDQRDPYTGECYATYPPGGCNDQCGPCPQYDIAIAPGAQCYGACAGLDELTCSSTPGCHAAYDGNARADQIPQFSDCWDIAPLPVNQGACEGLDAYSCAMHDDCVSQFEVTYGPTDAIQSRYFAACAPEPITGGSCLATTCAPGTHCEEQCTGACPPDAGGAPCDVYCAPTCVPDPTYSCANVDCGPGYMCVEQCDPLTPTPMGGTGGIGCWPSCVQIVNDPGECYGAVACDALPPACPADTTAGVLNGCWSGYCIPTSQCGPQDPGTCDTAACATPPPSCPSGTTAGVKNGCYTGYCIPDSSCPQLPCEALTDEASCQARMECSAVYSGDNCTCLPDGTCTCTSQTFARCETWWL